MKQGNWIAIDKALIHLMPKDRPYSIPEAMISLSVDLDNGKDPSINGCSKLWGWSRNKVRKFVTELRTGRGHLADSKGTYKGHLITLKIKGFREEEDSQGTVRGQSKDSKRDTTIRLKTKTKKKHTFDFDSIWEKYPNKDGKKAAEKHFNTTVKTEDNYSDINKALDNYLANLKTETWKKPKNGSTWFNNWQDWIDYEAPINQEKDYEIIIDGESVFLTETEYKQWKTANGR